MRGAGCTVHIAIPTVAVGNTASPALPPRRVSLRITHDRSSAESTDVSVQRVIWEEPDVTRYDFTLRFALPSAGMDMDEVADRLYGHGCDDALIGIGHRGMIALDFTREAPSARAAIMSAITDVSRAVTGAVLVEVAPDVVGVTDIAEMVGCSRQNIRQLLVSCTGTGLVPVHEGKQTLWHLAQVLRWLADEKSYRISDALIDLAETTMQVNLAIDALQADPEVEEELRALLA